MWSERTLFDLVARAYDASVAPELWPAFLERLADAGRAESALVLAHDLAERKDRVYAAAGIDAVSVSLYETSYAGLNPWTRRAALHAVPGQTGVGETICRPAELERSEFYDGFLRPRGVLHSMAACVGRDRAETPFCCLLRGRAEGPFEADELEGLALLAPHIRRALEISNRLGRAETRVRAGTAALDALAFGCLVVDAEARPVEWNLAAREIVADGDGLRLRGECLSAARPVETGRLHGLVRGACLTAGGRGLGAGGALAVPRPSGRKPLNLLVVPFRGGSEPGRAGRPAAIVFVTDPERQSRAGAGSLAGLFGLTPAEARIAAALLDGDSVEAAARRLHLSVHTVRNHLKSVFSKTGTARQSELVRAMLGGMAQVRDRKA